MPEFQRNPPTSLAGMMVQTDRPTDKPTGRQTDRLTGRQTDKFCIFSDMPPGIKPSQDGREGVLLKEKWPKYHFLAFSRYFGNHF